MYPFCRLTGQDSLFGAADDVLSAAFCYAHFGGDGAEGAQHCAALFRFERKILHDPRTRFIDRERAEKTDSVCLPTVSGQPAAGPLQCGGYAGGRENCGRDRPGRHQQCLHAVLYHQLPLYRSDHGRERSGGPVQGRKRPNGSAGHDRNAVLSIAGGFRCCYHPRPRHL